MSPSVMVPVSGSCSVAIVRMRVDFPRAVGAEQAVHADGNGEADVPEGADASGVGLGDVADLELHRAGRWGELMALPLVTDRGGGGSQRAFAGLQSGRQPGRLAAMSNDRYAAARAAVLEAVLAGAGHSEPALRRSAFENGALPSSLAALVGKVHDHAYRVTDEDVQLAQQAHGEDAVFEVIVSAALGASERRLRAGLAALESA